MEPQKEYPEDFARGLEDGRHPTRAFGHSFNPAWVTPQGRYDAYRAGYTKARG